ncbi:MAG: hypothetical protein DI601_00330 [Azospirillum brasilense]|nr:MAG: hypothetical protein DI601_00330 [Azospirillum brasilense]
MYMEPESNFFETLGEEVGRANIHILETYQAEIALISRDQPLRDYMQQAAVALDRFMSGMMSALPENKAAGKAVSFSTTVEGGQFITKVREHAIN